MHLSLMNEALFIAGASEFSKKRQQDRYYIEFNGYYLRANSILGVWLIHANRTRLLENPNNKQKDKKSTSNKGVGARQYF